MNIKEFTDMKKFEDIMANWAAATGLATVAVFILIPLNQSGPAK